MFGSRLLTTERANWHSTPSVTRTTKTLPQHLLGNPDGGRIYGDGGRTYGEASTRPLKKKMAGTVPRKGSPNFPYDSFPPYD